MKSDRRARRTVSDGIGTEDPGSEHWPVELRYERATRTLEIVFDNGARFSLPAEYLRVESPSAEVQGHGPGRKRTVAGRQHVGIVAIEPMGNYAVKIGFDDLHDTGIFSWSYLYELGRERTTRWRNYLNELDREGLSRDPRVGR